MSENLDLLEELQKLLKQKKSKAFYAERLGITPEEVDELLKELREKENVNYIKIEGVPVPEFTYTTNSTFEPTITESETNHKTGDKKITLTSNEPLSPKEIEDLVGVDNISTFVDRSWLKSHKNGTWTYSILVTCKIKDFYTSEELDNKLRNIFYQDFAERIISGSRVIKEKIDKWEISQNSLKSINEALFIYIADDHCGSIIKDSLFGNDYSGSIYAKRLLKVVEEVKKLNKSFAEIFIVRLGDELDGYNKKTTRYDHELDSLSNKEQFDIYTTANKLFYDDILSSNLTEKFTIINLSNSNHSGKGFSYIANKALEFWIEAKFPLTTIVHQDKFIDTYTFGNHKINLTHGKDEKYMGSPMPINLDYKTDLWLMEYNKKHILEGSFISTVKGDMHKYNINVGKSGRYINVPSISSGSMWIEHNYGDSKPGCLIEIYQKDSENIQSMPIWF